MTDESRRIQIEKALSARADKPPAERHTHPLPWRGGEQHFPVIELPLDVPLLNADSHRIRAELEVPDLDFVRKERTSAEAQDALTDLWRRAHRKFDKLKESLQVEGQTEPGVISRAGVMTNGNTRLVALRDLNEPDKQWIRVAVLDSDARPRELAQLELRLQVRDPLRDPYKLSNELLFVEEMAREFGQSDEQVAMSLGWSPSRPAIGKRKVELWRRILVLIREMQRRDPHLPIVFFDDKLQQLKELEQRYGELISRGETGSAGLLLDSWIAVARAGFSSVHQIRAVTRTDDFIGEYLLPRLGEEPEIGERAEGLVQARADDRPALPGVDDLGTTDSPPNERYDLAAVIRVLEADGAGLLRAPGFDDGVDAERLQESIRAAIKGAVHDRRAEDRAEDALNAPVEGLRRISLDLKRVVDTYGELRGTKEFERTARGKFEYHFRHARKRMKELEDLIVGKDRGKRPT